MFDKFLTRLILFPFTIIYGFIIGLRNMVYDLGIVRSSKFNLPVISVGNLTVGGAGKSPHIEYLIRLLHPYLNVATLSRGYKRKTRGFKIVDPRNNATQTGDEPLQFKRKFQDVFVAVAESRSLGIPMIVQNRPQTQVILLDDAFQHRSVLPGLNLLLTEYDAPYTKDFILPVGRLREGKNSAQRANMIIVSKCPQVLEESQALKLREDIDPLPHQELFFSYYKYLSPYFLFDNAIKKTIDKNLKVIVLAAIAKTAYMMDFLEDAVEVIQVLKFEDHHYFQEQEIARLALTLDEYKDEEVIILTTEKDAIRLELHKDYIMQQALPIFVLPIEVCFHFDGSVKFDRYIKDYLLNFTL